MLASWRGKSATTAMGFIIVDGETIYCRKLKKGEIVKRTDYVRTFEPDGPQPVIRLASHIGWAYDGRKKVTYHRPLKIKTERHK